MPKQSKFNYTLTDDRTVAFSERLQGRRATETVQRELFETCVDKGERCALRTYFTLMHGLTHDEILTEAALGFAPLASSNQERVMA